MLVTLSRCFRITGIMSQVYILNNIRLSKKEFAFMFNKMYSSLCLFSNKYVKNTQSAKDIVQEVFIIVWEKKITFNNKESVKPYLYNAVRNKSLDFLKNKHLKNIKYSTSDFEKIASEPYFLREVAVVETTRLVQKAIATLPKESAKIIKLGIKGYKNNEIAEELSISINTVKTQKKIIYKKLRLILNNNCLLVGLILIFLHEQ